ncbi:GNAT family N-acetyltransferase [Ningiella sp. W23]|uniref:GNAT family N-acetyltransferase n=1 Tax=Ningiella sp. W23 TaxID=3023715 RepID=UPI0037566862
MNEAQSDKDLSDWLSIRRSHSSSRQLLLMAYKNTSRQYSALQTLITSLDSCLILGNEHTKRSLGSDYVKTNTNVIFTQASHIKPLLGKDFDLVIYDCMDGIVANTLFAISGLIRRSGLLVMLCPKLANWPSYFARHQGIKFSYGEAHTECVFASFLSGHFLGDSQVAQIDDSGAILPIVASQAEPELTLENVCDAPPSSLRQSGFTLSKKQQDIFNKILRAWDEKHISNSLITGARGRGKSTLLGFLAFEALRRVLIGTIQSENDDSQIAICAPTASQAKIVLDVVNKLLTQDSSLSSSQISLIKNTNIIQSYAPDQSDQIPENSYLFIDEAASMAPELIDKLCEKVSHTVLSSTMDGYEGSGKGLLYRWLPMQINTTEHYRLYQAFRWDNNDALENMMAAIFSPNLTVLDAEQPTSTLHISDGLHCLNKSELLGDFKLFRECFSLLQGAHYQSTPNDIQRMLSASDYHIWLYIENSQCVGIICTIEEGGADTFYENQLRFDIAMGKRRVQGHMSAQALAQALQIPEVLGEPTLRINRIAVHPQIQGQGIGSQMLSCLKKIFLQTKNQKQNLSTSFGMTPKLVKFWQANSFRLVKLGYRKDTSSGAVTGHFMHSESESYKAIHDLAKASQAIDMHYLKRFNPSIYRSIPIELLTFENKETIEEAKKSITKQKRALFVNETLSFDMSKSSLAYCLYHSSESNLGPARSLFEELHQPNLSKTQKLENASKLRALMKAENIGKHLR